MKILFIVFSLFLICSCSIKEANPGIPNHQYELLKSWDLYIEHADSLIVVFNNKISPCNPHELNLLISMEIREMRNDRNNRSARMKNNPHWSAYERIRDEKELVR